MPPKKYIENVKIFISFDCPYCHKNVIDKDPTLTPWEYEGSESHYADSGINITLRCPSCKKVMEATA
jgi:hypothetical protein